MGVFERSPRDGGGGGVSLTFPALSHVVWTQLKRRLGHVHDCDVRFICDCRLRSGPFWLSITPVLLEHTWLYKTAPTTFSRLSIGGNATVSARMCSAFLNQHFSRAAIKSALGCLQICAICQPLQGAFILARSFNMCRDVMVRGGRLRGSCVEHWEHSSRFHGSR